LIKYDFLALGRALLPVQLAVVAVGAIASAFCTFFVRYYSGRGSSYNGTDNFEMLLGVFSGFALLLLAMVLTASYFMTLFLVARHFYKSFMGDEGYLTFTLPVTVHQHILAKTISGFIWMLVNLLVVVVALALLIFFGTASEGIINTASFGAFGETFRALIDQGAGFLIIEVPVSFVLTTLNSLLMIYFCITIGSVLAKKYKVAGAVIAYFVLATGVGIISSLAEVAVRTYTGGYDLFLSLAIFANDFGPLFNYLQVNLLISMAMAVLTMVAYYLFNHYFLSNRLNLE
jgi:hypothetical protein